MSWSVITDADFKEIKDTLEYYKKECKELLVENANIKREVDSLRSENSKLTHELLQLQIDYSNLRRKSM